MLKIGSVELAAPLIAAPLAGFSNPVYRQIMLEEGAGLVFSEMISDKALHYKNRRTEDMTDTLGERPLAMQIFGHDPDTMGEAAAYLSEKNLCDIIDINMGCPVKKVLRAGAGAYFASHTDEAAAVIKAVVAHTDRPVTVKMRAGVDAGHITCVELAEIAQEAGAAAVTVHGRTKAQMYTGKSDNRFIRMVREAVTIPVIGNGDIRTPADVAAMFAETNCDGVMIGRGLMGRPWFMRQATGFLTGTLIEEPSPQERLDMCLSYGDRLCGYAGEKTGILRLRAISGMYLAGLPSATCYRRRLAEMFSLAQMHAIIEEYRRYLNDAGVTG